MSEFNNQLGIPKMPEVKFNRNGYEIRADILALAQDYLKNEYSAKFAGWELTASRDEETGELVTTVAIPEFPGLETLMETAQRMYEFVNIDSNKKSR